MMGTIYMLASGFGSTVLFLIYLSCFHWLGTEISLQLILKVLLGSIVASIIEAFTYDKYDNITLSLGCYFFHVFFPTMIQ